MVAKTIETTLEGDRYETRSFSGVLTRRVLAFCVDYVLIFIFALLVGLLTLGIGWILFGIVLPITALTYVAVTLGGRHQSTLGMRMMGIRLERLDGGRMDAGIAVVHTILFWAGNTILTPFILLVALFTEYKRTLHDLLLGTVVVRTD